MAKMSPIYLFTHSVELYLPHFIIANITNIAVAHRLDQMMFYLSWLFGWSTKRVLTLLGLVAIFHLYMLFNHFGQDGRCTDDAIWERSYQLFEKHAIKIGGSRQRQYEFTPRPDDIFVVGGMKTGTTWLQHIMHLIRTKGDASFENIYNVTWYLPNYYLPYNLSSPSAWDLNGNQPAEPRIFKTHELYRTIPKTKTNGSPPKSENTIRYVVIQREMLGVVWSFIKFVPRMYGCDFTISWKLFHKIRLSKASRKIGDNYKIVNSFYKYRDDDNVLWLFFDDLVTDLKFCIQKLADFMRIELTGEDIDRIAEKSTYSWMKQHNEMFNFPLLQFADALGVQADWEPVSQMISSHNFLQSYLERFLFKMAITQDKEYFDQEVGLKYGFHTFDDFRNRTRLLNLKHHDTQFLTA